MSRLREWHERSKRVERLLSLLHLLAADALLYGDEHPRFQNTIEHVKKKINAALESMDRLELKIIHSDLIYDDRPLQKQRLTTESFRQSMRERGIESLIFEPGITDEELLVYARFMRLTHRELRGIGNLSQYLRDRGVRHIKIARLVDIRHEQSATALAGLPVMIRKLRNIREEQLEIIDAMHNETRVARILDIDAAKHIVEECLAQSAESSVALLALNAVRCTDTYTSGHALNTCVLSICFARYLGLPQDLLPDIGLAGLLQDIGKMFIPEEILNKPGKLLPEEWTLMENHTLQGARFLMGIQKIPRLAPLVAYEHHMHYDKSGYPRVGEDYQVNIASMITSLADFYDALTTTRPYKRAIPPNEAVELMAEIEDRKMEPRLKKMFLKMLGPYPIGSMMRLDDETIAIAIEPNPSNPKRPVTMSVFDSSGNRLEQRVTVDLSELDDDNEYKYHIREFVNPEKFQIEPADVLKELIVYPEAAS